jgi:hypothetical protein
MRLTLILLVVLACISLTLAACGKSCQEKKAQKAKEKALRKACKELGGGTKVKLEIDLGGRSCFIIVS